MDKHSAKGTGRVTSKDLGEHKIIEIIKSKLAPMPNMPVPFGDDVSAVSLDPKTVAVLKTDMLVGKTDVPKHMSLWQAARKLSHERQRSSPPKASNPPPPWYPWGYE
jgi:hypothetical protein